MSSIETWKPVVGYAGLYEVSDHGNVRSLDRATVGADGIRRKYKGRTLKPQTNRDGYHLVDLYRDGKAITFRIHRLVLSAFIGPCPDGFEACHCDGDPANNRLDNLRWDTRSGNRRDRLVHGTDHNVNKTHCAKGHPHFEENNRRSDAKRGWRSCLICHRADSYIRHYNIPSHQHWIIRDMYAERLLLDLESAETV